MTSDKLILMLLTIAPLTALSSCGCNSEKTKISDTMRGYVEPRMTENETFCFIGISHRRDTLFIDPVEYAEGKLKEKLKEKIPTAMCEQ